MNKILTEHDAFLIGAREVLAETVKEYASSKQLVDFIIKEADDHQILSLLLVNRLPGPSAPDYQLTEDYINLVSNGIIFETEDFTTENYLALERDIGGFVYDVDRVLVENYKEFVTVTEQGENIPIEAAQKTMKQKIMDMLRKVGRKVKAVPGYLWNIAKKAFNAAIKAGKSVASAIGRGLSAAWEFIKSAARGLKFGVKSGYKYGKLSGKTINFPGHSRATYKVGRAVGRGAGGVVSGVKATGRGISSGAKAVGKVKSGVVSGAKAVGRRWKPLSAIALVAAALGGSYKVYQRYFSAAAKACAGKTGAEREACIQEARKRAIQARIVALKNAMKQCQQAKNPEKCKADIAEKIQDLQTKLAA